MKTIGIIPARYDSTRFPGKPMVDLLGKSMIQRVYEQSEKATRLDAVYIATDDKRIYEHVKSFGGRVLMTSAHHVTGTSRVAEAAQQISGADVIVNIQGDEPTISPNQIDELVAISGHGIATQAKKIMETEDLLNPNVVKVVFNKNNQALYFSRQAIPYGRDLSEKDWIKNFDYYRHIGIYSFDRDTLLKLEKFTPSNIEKMESLEQLSWLDNGIDIKIGITNYNSIGIDTPKDAERVRKILEKLQ
jgi:3-deoxy-manno-octulosonate cytidylyltransferase (CMP-KDO synthetase)